MRRKWCELLKSLCAREIVQLFQQETLDFFYPDLCPPNTPDLNPVDYRIFGLMEERGYIVHDTCPRYQRLEAAPHWQMGKYITKRHRRNSCSMEKRLRASTKAKGHHFEHLLNWKSQHTTQSPKCLWYKWQMTVELYKSTAIDQSVRCNARIQDVTRDEQVRAADQRRVSSARCDLTLKHRLIAERRVGDL